MNFQNKSWYSISDQWGLLFLSFLFELLNTNPHELKNLYIFNGFHLIEAIVFFFHVHLVPALPGGSAFKLAFVILTGPC